MVIFWDILVFGLEEVGEGGGGGGGGEDGVGLGVEGE